MEKVLVAMSGGVDSSVAAALLKKEGFQVVGGTMEIFPEYEQPSIEEGGCCSLSAIEDAKRVADQLDIPHYTFNMKKIFEKEVINNFVEEYAHGRTPNPCVVCNNEIKFKTLLQKALEIDCDYLATGHYSRIIKGGKRCYLKKGIDHSKDQSYMLYGLTQFQLEHTLMPLGVYQKTKVREIARESGLRIYNKPDSQEICFVPDNDYTRFLEENHPEISEPGYIYDTEGKKLGKHEGLHNYTIGQRRGLGISMPYPIYVVDINYRDNILLVGKNEYVFSSGLVADNLNWIAFPELKRTLQVETKIRYNSPAVQASISPGKDNQTARVEFEKKQRAVTPGQSVVFYRGDLVLGGGLIREAI